MPIFKSGEVLNLTPEDEKPYMIRHTIKIWINWTTAVLKHVCMCCINICMHNGMECHCFW